MPISVPFAFVGSAHPFRADLDRFAAALALEPAYLALGGACGNGRNPTQRTLLRALPAPSGEWELRWVYDSAHVGDRLAPSAPVETFLYRPAKQRLERYTFPDDPYLSTAGQFIGGRAGTLLRYVPRRRLTCRFEPPDTGGAPVVGKLARQAENVATYRRLGAVFEVVEGSSSTFRVARPAGYDPATGAFYQELLPGRELAALLAEGSYASLLPRLGAVHRQLHRLEPGAVPRWDARAFLDGVKSDLSWLAFFWPERRQLLVRLEALLLDRVPPLEPARFSFCHGDFRPAQILVDGDSWSVIDFDGAHRGDPYLELARTIAYLSYDGSPLARTRDAGVLDAAAGAYLEGYEAESGEGLDRKRLLWFRVCCELHLLGRLIKRDLVTPSTFERAGEVLEGLAARLARPRAAARKVPA